ncbi:uncharacterized protein LOC122303227 isoform X2 [Carya illinoinensis]|uniref:uncharacterized protein LOC122303227 isoform X2 n=1 Tax=Carya illinoinensis TaxID=32201 RepID=UPI001C7237EF|nr:uncharacterized protein LOC122303227 isoform X2 [Carya illinoinensis]
MSKRRPSLHPDLWLRHSKFPTKTWFLIPQYSDGVNISPESLQISPSPMENLMLVQVLHAMIQMGVLVPTTGDMIAARDGQHSSSLTADQPFQFPATFTFVRAFSVLDGINLERALTLDLILLRLPNREFDLCFFQL